MIRAIVAALPTLRTAIAGCVAWAVLMAASAFFALTIDGRLGSPGIYPVLALFACGGLLAFVPALTLARLFRPRRKEQAFAIAFIAFCTITIGSTGMLFALHFRLYFSQWHADALSVRWAFELAFTIAAALYQFAVLGMELFFPVGLAALFAISLWHAARSS